MNSGTQNLFIHEVLVVLRLIGSVLIFLSIIWQNEILTLVISDLLEDSQQDFLALKNRINDFKKRVEGINKRLCYDSIKNFQCNRTKLIYVLNLNTHH